MFDFTSDEHHFCDPILFISHAQAQAHSLSLATLTFCLLTVREVDFYLLFAMVFDECHTIIKKNPT